MESVSYVAHEAEMSRLERIIKRLWILCIIIFLAFVGSNAAWLYYESQWEVVESTQTIEANADNGGSIIGAIIGDDSEVNYNGSPEADEDN